MAISKARKDDLVAQYKELIARSRAIFLTEYGGMSVKEMEQLRQKVREADGTFHVTKNTLLKHALRESDKPVEDVIYLGQLGTGFALGEAPAMAKALVNYAKDSDFLTIRGAILGQETLTADQVEALAQLPSLEQLRAQLLGLLNAPARNVAALLNTSVQQVVNVLDAYAKRDESANA